VARVAHDGIDRRSFLRLAALGAGTVALSTWPVGPAAAGSPGPGGVVSGLAVGRGRSVAVGQDAAGHAAVWLAEAGGPWQLAPGPPPAPAVLGDVTAVRGGYVAAGSLTGSPATWWSSDGSSWRPGAVLAVPGHLVAVAASGTGVLAAGAVTDGETAEGIEPLLVTVARSGGAWGRLGTSGIGALPHGSLTAVAHHAGSWVVAGATHDRSTLWSGDDGEHWTAHPDGATEPIVWSSLLGAGGELLALGTAVAGGAVHLARSVDGRAWQLAPVPNVLAELGVDLRAAATDAATGVVTAGGAGALVQDVVG